MACAAGGVVGSGEEAAEEALEESADADNPGVDSRSSVSRSAPDVVNLELRDRLAALSEETELPDDSSKERLGERCTRRFIMDESEPTADTGSEGACVR